MKPKAKAKVPKAQADLFEEIEVSALALNKMVLQRYNSAAALTLLSSALGFLIADHIPREHQQDAIRSLVTALKDFVTNYNEEQDKSQ